MDKRSYDELEAMLADARQVVPVGSHWQHYKGGKYTIVDLAILEESQTVGVIYRPHEHPDAPFIRPLSVWLETVEWDGKTLARFSKLD